MVPPAAGSAREQVPSTQASEVGPHGGTVSKFVPGRSCQAIITRLGREMWAMELRAISQLRYRSLATRGGITRRARRHHCLDAPDRHHAGLKGCLSMVGELVFETR
jgi:hypothetical protein